ncbi:carbamoyltransferase HypF [Nonomuraea turkmeniaca]|uniref:Carbamoyltransferase n=1 Tax=Nonomuraea turkmeniaca TaxID=103838 RepID=A0A5S4EVR4_9ACTN|nr:carbamoyltransferase HypF [Nonomuraea turkmeniaca]
MHVEGIVQGVGFRPFVRSLAIRLGLAGRVRGDVNGVHIEIEGALAGVEEFLTALERDAPALSDIERVTVVSGEPAGHRGFTIAASDPSGLRRALVPADTATCDDCLRELADPADRRHRYPFIGCVTCGPRFTIVRGAPYDRPRTTMAGYTLCPACAAEYHAPGNRRFHDHTAGCPACGPRLRLLDARGADLCGDPIACAVTLLHAGRVVAVKGLGGFHLAVPAAHEHAAATLRGRKHREDQPFAVMAADLAQARRLCTIDDTAAGLLTSRARPIVLLPRRPGAPVAAGVAPGHRTLGLLLPYTALHHLLLAELGEPIALAGGDVSGEPIAHTDADALTRLGGIADAFLTHDRPIHVRADDSVLRPMSGEVTVLRRARGYAPEPLPLRHRVPRPVLACGAELNSTICLAAERRAYLSQHLGDLHDQDALRAFAEAIDHYCGLSGIRPDVVAHDLHTGYPSTRHALAIPGADLVGVQHHHAHIASCLADNGDSGPVIGVAFDGLGHGPDGALWGGEFLRADLATYERLGHLTPVPMPAGAIRQPWRMAAAYLRHDHPGLAVVRRNAASWAGVLGRADAPLTSSAARLFDAVSALLGIRDTVTYDGQAAIELEQHADPAETGTYPAAVTLRDLRCAGDLLAVDGGDLVRAAAEDLTAGVPTPVIAGRFHNGVADAIARACQTLRQATGLSAVALSGSVFQNALLLEGTVERLRAAGFRVLRHIRVPPHDGGLSLGQAAVAAARDRA